MPPAPRAERALARQATAVLALAGALSTACGGARPAPVSAALREPSVPTVLRGPHRQTIAWKEPLAAEKAALFRLVNEERRAAGVPELGYSLLAARVGDDFCLDAALSRSVGHWDLAGRAPYLRFALAGGVDAHAENFASRTQTPGPITEPLGRLLLESHERFMAERPPDDGHRRTVLDPQWTHVGIGAALVGGEFRMTEEYVRQVLEWVEVPEGPVPAGSYAPFAAKLPPGWSVGGVEVSHEPPPEPISRSEAARRGAYAYPPPVRTLRPELARGMTYSGGGTGDFPVRGGVLRLRVPLASGRGNYYVHVYANAGPAFGVRLTSVSAALVRAE